MTAGMAALGYQTGVLAKFAWGNSWDAQRIGGRFQEEFRDYSTIAIGLYAAAAGITREEILTIQNLAAAAGSKFKDGTDFDKNYRFLPEVNVKNTDLGYQLFFFGAIGSGSPGDQK